MEKERKEKKITPVLSLEYPNDDSPTEYILAKGEISVWITVDGWSVYIARGEDDEKPFVQVSRRGEEC
jgi:hypothetical protein